MSGVSCPFRPHLASAAAARRGDVVGAAGLAAEWSRVAAMREQVGPDPGRRVISAAGAGAQPRSQRSARPMDLMGFVIVIVHLLAARGPRAGAGRCPWWQSGSPWCNEVSRSWCGRRTVTAVTSVELTPEMCITGREITEPRLAPDGDTVAMVVRWGSASAIAVIDLRATAAAPVSVERLVATIPAPAPGRGLGGGCFDWTPDGDALVVACEDGQLWRVPVAGGRARRLTDHDSNRRAEAPAVAPDGTFVAYLLDQAEVWMVGLDAGGPLRRLDDGSCDFCFDPAVSPRSDQVVWMGWSVPDMPWDGARIHGVALGADAVHHRPAVGRPGAAAQQPRWTPAGELLSVRDETGWANVWLDDRVLVDEPFEHAGPTWGTGQRSFVSSPDGRTVAFTRNESGFGRLCVVDVESGGVTTVGRGVHGQLSWRGGRLAALRSGARTPTEVVVYDTRRDGWPRQRVAVGPVSGWERADLVEPEPAVFEASDGATLYARRYVAGHGRTLCWVHGGPTDQWQVEFLPRVAYWQARGWDVLVPDPRGSTGHGRAYQQALRGRWGELDTADVADVLRASHQRGTSRAETTVLVGGSSGGLVVLGVLAGHRGLAAAGVVSYPVTDLASLTEVDHRFEAHAPLSLVGPLDDVDRYRQRSPLSHAHEIDVPLLVMHGDLDPVVPLRQSLDLVDAMRRAGRDVELQVMQGEGHGFRRPANRLAEYELVERFLERIVPSAAPEPAPPDR